MGRNPVNLIRGRKWYHQGFDGTPMFLDFIGEAEVRKEKRKPSGTEADVRVCFFSHGRGDWYIDMAGMKRGVRVLINLAKKDPNISTKLLSAWKKDERECERFFWKEFPKINLKKLSGEELLRLWEQYYRMFVRRFTSSAIIDHFALGTDQLIGRMLRKEAGKIDKESQFTRMFSIATAPVHQSFINQAEIDLLKIILGKSRETLSDYQQKYFWTKNNYATAKVLSVDHFRKEILARKKSRADLAAELKKIENIPKLNKIKKQKLFRQYHLSSLLRTLLKISEDFTWWQDERKKFTYWNTHIGVRLLKEIGRRTRYHVEALKYAVPSEIARIMKARRPQLQELRRRQKSSVLFVTRDGFVFLTGKAANHIRKVMLGSQDYSRIQDIRGLSATLGRVIGTVKVLRSATEVDKVKLGDIIVAVMTRPDYIVAMKKAAAIVTNEGGITSHAAIVSRELGVPCIIGTKIATQVFKDGDKVEVNANHGWVRKINV